MSGSSQLRIALVLLLLAAPSTAGRAEQPPIRTFTTANGLGSDTVTGVVADSRGFLWFRTSDGLSRFDGYTFTTFTTSDGLPANAVSDVCETRDGALWVGTAAGLCRFDPSGGRAGGALFALERLGENPEANDVYALLETSAGELWCGTEGGLFRLAERDGRWVAGRVDVGPAKGVYALAGDRWGGVWVGISGAVGLVRPDGRVETYPLSGAGGAFDVRTLYTGPDGSVWIGSPGGVWRAPARASADAPVEVLRAASNEWMGWGNAFLQQRDGTILAATTTGLWRATAANGPFERDDTLAGLCAREVWDLAEDRDGNLWLATTCGVLRVDRYGFTGYAKADGLASLGIDSIFESNAGDLVVTTHESQRMVHRLDGARFRSVAPSLPKTETYYGWGWGQTITQDREGAWWVPSGGGVYRYRAADRPEDALRTRPEAIFTGLEIFRVFEDSRGDVWLSRTGPSGLLLWERATGRVVDRTAETGVVAEYAAFCETRDGALWIGMGNGDDGLLRYVDGRFERLTTADGVPAGWIRDFYLDDAGRLWIASSLGGLARVDDPAADRPVFVAYTMAEGLSSNNAWCVVSDELGRIYVGTTRGVDRIEVATGSVKHYTSADGLPRSQPQTACRDRRGALWFGSVFGLARLDPEPERAHEPPRTLVTGLRVSGVSRPVSALGEAVLAPLELGPDENSVSLDFLGLGASLGEELRYQYRLEGANGDWSAPALERTVTFANLAPGSYRFSVRAVDAEGLASPEPAVVAFTVAAPLWRRWWVLTLAAALAGLAGYGLYRYRVRRLVEIERVRTRIATDLHDDLGANLTRIAILSEVASYQRGPDAADGGSLASIARISRESVTSMSDIVWAINPKRDSFDDLVSRMRQLADEALATGGVEVGFTAPESEGGQRLGHDLRRQLYLIFKEAVNNAARHSGCRRVEIAVELDRRRLALTVSDDGRGFDPSTEVEGNGLANIAQRARAIGARLEVRTAPGSCTTVSLDVPLGRHPG
jgi:signal transduction histidine kinase/ligand-binding sensor domain-containing protein